MLTVLLGGARSGKSSLAVRLGRRHGGPVTYIATSPRIPDDDDLDTRIAAHRAERPAGWHTIEEELDLAAAVDRAGDSFVIIDCLTVWLGNLLHHGHDGAGIERASVEALGAVTRRTAPTIVITNEVGSGIIPERELARAYRDLLGRTNQSWVASADRALLLVAGRALPLSDPDDLLG